MGLLLCQPLVYDGTFPMSTSCAETFTGLQRTRICILADSCHCSEWHLAASWWAYIFLTFLYIHPYTSLYILTHSYTFIHIHSFASYFCQGLAPTAVWYHNPHIRSRLHCIQRVIWSLTHSYVSIYIYCDAKFRKGSHGPSSQKKRPHCKRTFSGLTWSLECEYVRRTWQTHSWDWRTHP